MCLADVRDINIDTVNSDHETERNTQTRYHSNDGRRPTVPLVLACSLCCYTGDYIVQAAQPHCCCLRKISNDGCVFLHPKSHVSVLSLKPSQPLLSRSALSASRRKTHGEIGRVYCVCTTDVLSLRSVGCVFTFL